MKTQKRRDTSLLSLLVLLGRVCVGVVCELDSVFFVLSFFVLFLFFGWDRWAGLFWVGLVFLCFVFVWRV